MPTADSKKPVQEPASAPGNWGVDDRELDALAHRLAAADTASVTILFEQLGAPVARRLGKELRRRAVSNPAIGPIYERAVTELMCADLACERGGAGLASREPSQDDGSPDAVAARDRTSE